MVFKKRQIKVRPEKKIAVFQVILENKIGSVGRQKVVFLGFFSN